MRRSSAAVRPGSVNRAPARTGPDMRYLRLAKDFRRDGRKPGLRIVGLARAELARRIGRADAAGTLDVGQQSVLRLVDAGDRDAIVGGRQTVAGVDQFWRGGRSA